MFRLFLVNYRPASLINFSPAVTHGLVAMVCVAAISIFALTMLEMVMCSIILAIVGLIAGDVANTLELLGSPEMAEALRIVSELSYTGSATFALEAIFAWLFGPTPSGNGSGNGTGSSTSDTIYVTPDGVALPKGRSIPDYLIENPNRSGSYGITNPTTGKFQEVLRIDPPTPLGSKGPSYSHYHLYGEPEHYVPTPEDPGLWPF